MKSSTPHTILITGASSGIGAALAKAHAATATHLFLCGRDATRLEAVAAACRAVPRASTANGTCTISTHVVDVTDVAAMRAWIESCHAQSPLEVVYANAGVATGVETESAVRNTFDINIGGVLNTAFPAVDCFRTQPAGSRKQLVITASIAGYHGLASAPAYSATKACVKAWGEGLRGLLQREGIRVNVICPGFVRSGITDKNTFKMPFFWEADRAAAVIVRRVNANVGLIAFPWPLRLVAWAASCLPNALSQFIYRSLPDKAPRT